jgi:hypothetical protein
MSTTEDDKVIKKIDQNTIVKAISDAILKEEADNWGILYKPEKDLSFTINPVGAFIWKRLNTGCSVRDLIDKVKETFINVPEAVENDVVELIERLLEKELVTVEDRGGS